MNVVSHKHKVIILTPSKCSTHSLKTFLESAGIEFDEPKREVNNIFYHSLLSEICYAYYIPPHRLSEFKIIQIVRNPYDRMISSYFSQKQIFPLLPTFDGFLDNLQRSKYLLPFNVDEFYTQFYGDFNYKKHSLSNGNWGGLRFYFDQSWWNNLGANVSYFKLENINQDSSKLCNFLGINQQPYPKVNSKNYNKISLTPQNKEVIYNLYTNDFKMYDYSK